MSSSNAAPFGGFTNPEENWSKLPHEFINRLPDFATMAEMKVVLYILRHTWGFKEEEKTITIDEFMHGRKRSDGSRIDVGTGLSKTAVVDGLKVAASHGFVFCDVDDSDAARIEKTYRLTENKSGIAAGVASGYISDVAPGNIVQRKKQYKETKVNTSSGEQVAAAQASPDEIETPSTVKAEEKPTVKHNLNVAEQAVAIYLLHVTDEEAWTLKTVIEEVRSTLKPLWESVGRADSKSRTDEDKQKMAASVKSFTEWYKRKHPDLDLPRRNNAVLHYLEFKAEYKKRQAATPAQSDDPNRITADELEAAGGDLDAAISAKRKRLAVQE